MAAVIDIKNVLPRHETRTYNKRKLSDIKRLVIHTSDWLATPEQIASYDISPKCHISPGKGCPAVTYAEMINTDGVCFSTLDWTEVSWHVGVWNKSSLGLVLLYKCSDSSGEDVSAFNLVYAPTTKMLSSAWKRSGDILLKLGLPPTDKHLVGHRELRFTGWLPGAKGSRVLRKTCPGWGVDMDAFRTMTAKYVQLVLKRYGYTGQVDGIFGPLSDAAFKKYLTK